MTFGVLVMHARIHLRMYGREHRYGALKTTTSSTWTAASTPCVMSKSSTSSSCSPTWPRSHKNGKSTASLPPCMHACRCDGVCMDTCIMNTVLSFMHVIFQRACACECIQTRHACAFMDIYSCAQVDKRLERLAKDMKVHMPACMHAAGQRAHTHDLPVLPVPPPCSPPNSTRSAYAVVSALMKPRSKSL